MLRCAAGELLQRVSATHRQCEADLRKLLVHLKMKSIADIIDINSPQRNDGLSPAAVIVDIEKVASLSQFEMSPERRSQLRKSHLAKQYDWQSLVRSWGDSFANPPVLPTSPKSLMETPRLRRKSMQNLLFSVQLQQLSSSLDTEELNLRASFSMNATPNPADTQPDDDDIAITRQSVMEYMEHHGSYFRAHTKKMYSSQEYDSIRKLINAELESQLEGAKRAESLHEKALVPVLYSLNGFVYGRLSGHERAAVSAYSTGALGDQVRIMRSLLNIFLSFIRDRDSQSDSVGVRSQVSTDITETNGLTDYLHSLSYSDGGSRVILTSPQVRQFLHWAASIGDIIGLQAIRFMTELVHRCLSKRMAQRSLEQTENLPAQSFGDNVLNEFKREVTHGIYSRRRHVTFPPPPPLCLSSSKPPPHLQSVPLEHAAVLHLGRCCWGEEIRRSERSRCLHHVRRQGWCSIHSCSSSLP